MVFQSDYDITCTVNRESVHYSCTEVWTSHCHVLLNIVLTFVPFLCHLIDSNPYFSRRVTFGPQNHCQRIARFEQDLANRSLLHRFL
jgi:hypothetical protein